MTNSGKRCPPGWSKRNGAVLIDDDNVTKLPLFFRHPWMPTSASLDRNRCMIVQISQSPSVPAFPLCPSPSATIGGYPPGDNFLVIALTHCSRRIWEKVLQDVSNQFIQENFPADSGRQILNSGGRNFLFILKRGLFPRPVTCWTDMWDIPKRHVVVDDLFVGLWEVCVYIVDKTFSNL